MVKYLGFILGCLLLVVSISSDALAVAHAKATPGIPEPPSEMQVEK